VRKAIRGQIEAVPRAPAVASRVIVKPSSDEAGLNRTERVWLQVLRAQGFDPIHVQAVTLKLAHDTRYTPDFMVVHAGAVEFHEVKGFMREDAHVKIKVAARLFPWARFIVVRKTGATGWTREEVKP
jgi:hypothetical protein